MSSFETCPKCSYPVPTGAAECPACGIVYAKYRGSSAERPPSPSLTAGDRFNPYAPPESDLSAPPTSTPGASGDVWRAGSVLVMAKTAVLPDRCVRCNRQATVRLRRKLVWHRPLIYLAILLHILLYLVIALIVRKRAEIHVPLCSEHDRQRRNKLKIAWGVILGSLLIGALGFTSQDLVLLVVLGLMIFVVGLFLVSNATKPVVPKKIDERHVWLKKISPAYLADLPPAPSHLALS